MKIYCLGCKLWVEVDKKDQPCPKCGLRMCGFEDISKKLPDYEADAAREVMQWMNEPPGQVTQMVNKIVRVAAEKASIVVSQSVADQVTKRTTSLLELLQDLSCYTVLSDSNALKRKLQDLFGDNRLSEVMTKVLVKVSGKGVLQVAQQLGYQAHTIADLRMLNLQEIDKLAGQYMGIGGNKGLATAEGLLIGLGGFALLLVDIPVITAINFRYLQQIASCFGYDQDLPQEKIITLRIFMIALGGDSGLREGLSAKVIAAYDLRALAYALSRKWTYDTMAKNFGLRGMLAWLKKNAPQEFAKVVTKRKAAAAIPILGGGISASINYAMTSYTGKVGWYYFRYRKIMEQFGGLRVAPVSQAPLS